MREFRCVPTGLEPPRDGPGATQTAHGGAHRGSRQPHEAPRSLQRRPDTPGSDFDAILGRFWGPRDLEKPQKVLYCQRISWFSRFRKGAFNRGPRSSKRGPNEPQARPGRPQERPKSPQDRSKSRPERAKRRHPGPPQESTQGAPSRPDASREPFGSPFWLHLGAPEPHFRAF